jgi:pyruvate/2-oxoglutarate dehydrogenase complex dihydrolipoamide dehydrogenase (E3) component
MIASARIAHDAKRGPEFGIHSGSVQVNMAEVVARKNEIVESFRDGLQRKVDSRPSLDLYCGHGRFTTPHETTARSWQATRSSSIPAPGLASCPFRAWIKSNC